MSGEAKRKRKRGYQARDWDGLFKEWLVSGVTKSTFLRSKGINPSSGQTYNRTKDWDLELKKARDTLVEQAERQASVKGKQKDVVDAAVPSVTPEVMETARPGSSDVPPSAAPSPWQVVEAWRRNQALEDYKTADAIRSQIKLILKKAVAKTQVVDAVTGETRVDVVTTLTPIQIRALAQAAADLQRIQRLALGLSTENVGIDAGGSHVERQGGEAAPTGQAQTEEPIPTFVVEMSKRGKFMRQRPRRVR